MPKEDPWEPPEDPDFEALARAGWAAWERDKPSVLAFDTETTGLAYFDTAFCVTAAWPDLTGTVQGYYFELERFDSREAVRRILTRTPTLVGHNTKFDLQKTALGEMLDPSQLTAGMIEDTQVLATLVNEHRPLGLKELMVEVLKWEDTMEVEYKSGPKKGEFRTVVREKYLIQEARRKLKLTQEDGYDKLPRGIVVPYAITDAVGTMRLYQALKPLIERYPELVDLYAQEMELTLLLLEMENAGLGVDMEYVKMQVKAYQNKMVKHDTKIQEIVGCPVGKNAEDGEFNPGSDKQIKEIFTGLGFVRDSYDAENMAEIKHPLAAAILARRDDSKILSTYLRAILNEQRDDVLHPSFRQNVSTGRMSSGREKG